ncbi:MAG: hypothetical protein KJ621_16215 [Proteobacteria bacterium]|nr:hypothetical protein [Pseudomonadota bacterium]
MGPFSLDAKDIIKRGALDPGELHDFMRTLLLREARRCGIPVSKVRATPKIGMTIPDGGLDADIVTGHPSKAFSGTVNRAKSHRSDWIPQGLSGWQYKYGTLTPGKIAGELLDSNGNIKKGIQDVMSKGGTYVLVCGGQLLTNKMVSDRKNKIVEVLKSKKIK